ncbi:MAG: XamI family restriction endonuclease [Armatimonadetes bacterium]|nr:XamI family restriction endonuclease [Armatimonadota bacterium]
MIAPPRWTKETLENERQQAIEVFKKQRMEEPLEAYLHYFDKFVTIFEEVLERTVDLKELESQASELMTDEDTLIALRYLTGPPVSTDDLVVLAESKLSKAALKADPEGATRVVSILRDGLDRRRFPWFTESRESTEAERTAATIASAALVAAQKTATLRRSDGKKAQEAQVAQALLDIGYTNVPTRKATNISLAPGPGEFCGESHLGERKADFLVGLYDGRCMPIECKVSNSSTNSVKRLNNDAAVKAVYWDSHMGSINVVPTAVLGGVFKLHNLESAQAKGLTLFWAHHLSELTDWLVSLKA